MRIAGGIDIACCRHAKVLAEERGINRFQGRLNLSFGPDKEGAFSAFCGTMGDQTVGILGGVEATLRRGHLAGHVAEDITDGLLMALFARNLPCLQIGDRKLSLIIEHLLEVGDMPLPIHRVAVEAAAQMIADAACSHAIQGPEHDGKQRRVVCRRLGASLTQQKEKHRGAGELG